MIAYFDSVPIQYPLSKGLAIFKFCSSSCIGTLFLNCETDSFRNASFWFGNHGFLVIFLFFCLDCTAASTFLRNKYK